MIERHVNAPSTTLALLTFKEAMDFLRVSRSTIYRLMWAGQLRGYKVGSTWRFYEHDLLAAVAAPSGEGVEAHSVHVREG
jgi:excisionase family DNA binding protein